MVDFRSLVPWRSRSDSPARRGDFQEPFVAFRREMERMFDEFFDNFPGRALGSWSAVTPHIDLNETDKELIVTAELPGLDDKDFEVTVSGDVVTLKGEKRAEHEEKRGDAHYVERRFGAFARAIRLPFEPRDAKIDAKYDKGVLTIRVPKPAELQRPARRIDVQKI